MYLQKCFDLKIKKVVHVWIHLDAPASFHCSIRLVFMMLLTQMVVLFYPFIIIIMIINLEINIF